MDTQQAAQMLRNIKQAGLSNNKVAQELINELNAYIKESSLQKLSFYELAGGGEDFVKPVFFYWATAALVKLQNKFQQTVNLTIPTPTGSETAQKFGNRVSNTPVGAVLESIWEASGKDWTVDMLKKVIPVLNGNYRDGDQAAKWAEDWAFALSGHDGYDTSRLDKRPSKNSYPWPKIQAAATKKSTLEESVIDAISKGIFRDGVFADRKWTKTVSVGGDKVRPTNISLTNPDDQGNVDVSDGGDLMDDIQDDLSQGGDSVYNTEAEDMIEQEAKKALDAYGSIAAEVERELESIDVTESIEDTVDTLIEGAWNLANRSILPPRITDSNLTKKEKEAFDTDVMLGRCKFTADFLDHIVTIFNTEDANWLLDSHLYLDRNWSKMLLGFDSESMKLLDDLIKQEQNQTIALGLKCLTLGINDASKMIAIKNFADNCVSDPKKLQKAMSGYGVTAWYVQWVAHYSGFDVTVQGKEMNLHAQGNFTGDVTASFWNHFMDTVEKMLPAERSKLEKLIVAQVKRIAPQVMNKAAKNIQTMVAAAGKGLQTKAHPTGITRKMFQGYWKGNTAVRANARSFFGILASELVRYRYYMDLMVHTAPSGSAGMPKNLGNPACDGYVANILGPLPTAYTNDIKHDVYEDFITERWKQAVADALAARVKVVETSAKTIFKQSEENLKLMGIVKGSPTWDLYVEAYDPKK
tara:strand:+ start:923 stop:3010 length:2088 start_codon:yes stop_codon:yes gene_type:complete